MKKNFTIALCFFFFTGCSGETAQFESKTYHADASQVQSIQVDVRDKKIEIELVSDPEIEFEYYESEQEKYDISVSDGNLVITEKIKKNEPIISAEKRRLFTAPSPLKCRTAFSLP